MSQTLRDQLQATLSGTHTLERELGGGGMSKVFVAEETRLGRKVVVKVLSPELAQGLSVERFEREIKTAAALQQANIVPVLSAGDTNGLPFYTMPFVTGESLRARLGRGPLAVNEVVSVMRDVARALAYAHRQGVVHRDIKPDNVLLSEGAAVVTDFGIAKAISAARTQGAGATLTQIGTSIGTPAYMAPEQAAGDPDIDQRADIYSLGATMYELLTGQVVFANRTPQRMLAAHMSETPVPVAQLRPDTPQQLADLVMQCLAKDAKDRPQDAGQILLGLETTGGGSMASMPAVLLGGPGMLKKALAIYTAAFVAVAILAKAAIVGIGLPDWVFPGSLIVMALGLPVVLWTGYVQRVARRAMTATPTFTPGGHPATTAHGTIATIALKAAPHVSWYKTARGGMYAFGTFIVIIAAFMAMRAFGIGPFGSLLSTGRLSDKDQILLADFRITNADSTLRGVVSEAVRAGLSESSVITLMSPGAVASALQRMQQPRDARLDSALARTMAVREGVKAIIDGDVTGVAGGYVVSMRLITADSGVVLASSRETGEGPSGLINAVDQLTRTLRDKAGESLRAIHAGAPLADVTTASMDALRLYGEAVFANDVESDFIKAITLLRRAVAIDSTFAMAWRKLAVAMSNNGFPQSQVDSASRRAYQNRDRLTERERDWTVSFYFASGPGRDRAKAAEVLEGLLRRGDSLLTVNYANLLISRRQPERAESLFLAEQKRDPKSSFAFTNAGWAILQQGRFDDAIAAAVETRRRFPTNASAADFQTLALAGAGRFDEAQRLADSLSASADSAARGYGMYTAAASRLLRGRIADWRAARNASRAFDASRGLTVPAIFDSVIVSNVDASVRGDQKRAVDRLDRSLAASPLRSVAEADRAYLPVAEAYAIAGRPDRARAILEQRQREMRDTALVREQAPALHNALGVVLLAEGNAAEAVAEFRLGDMAPDGPAHMCVACISFSLAQAFDAAGQSDSAVFHYERFRTTGDLLRLGEWNDPTRRAGALQRLGELYEAKGDAPNAAKAYREFIELWKNADPELQPRVAEARRRLAKLAPVERPR